MAHGRDRKIFFFSRGAEKITGTKRETVLGRDCHEIFTPRLCGSDCVHCDDSCKESTGRSAYTAIFNTSDSTRKELEIIRQPLIDASGKIIGTVIAMSDATRLRELETKVGTAFSFAGIIGRDHAMQALFTLIRDIAQSDFPVAISGESGTGKELVAAAIHNESSRRDGLFVPLNCGALPEGTIESELFGHVRGAFTGAIRDKKGRFELAHKGTLFLDEVAELSPAMQVKLLRVLQEGVFEPVGGETSKKVDVRIICATNKNLKELVSRKIFREDLFYRLSVMPIELPPLRNRRNDIELLARHFLRENSVKLSRPDMGISDEAMSRLMDFAWPGNVRQLQNTIQFALIKCRGKVIMPEHLPPEMTGSWVPALSAQQTARKAGRKPKLVSDTVRQALVKTGGNKAKAARVLGVGRATLYNFLNEHPEIGYE
jgi:PAS domain S-box-containing protein